MSRYTVPRYGTVQYSTVGPGIVAFECRSALLLAAAASDWTDERTREPHGMLSPARTHGGVGLSRSIAVLQEINGES